MQNILEQEICKVIDVYKVAHDVEIDMESFEIAPNEEVEEKISNIGDC